jgi:hypothetical protein
MGPASVAGGPNPGGGGHGLAPSNGLGLTSISVPTRLGCGRADAMDGGQLRDGWFDGAGGWGAAASSAGRWRWVGQINFFAFAIKFRATARVRGRKKRRHGYKICTFVAHPPHTFFG